MREWTDARQARAIAHPVGRVQKTLLKRPSSQPMQDVISLPAQQSLLIWPYSCGCHNKMPNPATTSAMTSAMTPLEAIMQRLDGSTGFPALSSTITDINRIAASDSENLSKLARTILRDVSITRKLLHIVNSATYGQYGGRIHTVSKAILILGFDAVRNAAMSLMLLEFSKGKSQARVMQDEIVTAYFSGVVSKSLCGQLGVQHHEEAIICTMFQHLGKLLATFYLYDDSLKIHARMQSGMKEDLAALEVLGVSYEELGIAMAKKWNFPDRLVHGMRQLMERELVKPKTEEDRLRIAANLANELCHTALNTEESAKAAALDALVTRYAKVAPLKAEALTAALGQAMHEVAESAPALNLPVANSRNLATISAWSNLTENTDSADPMTTTITDDALLDSITALDAAGSSSESVHEPEQILTAGVRDVTEALVTDFNINDVLQLVLETMYRGMGFSRTLIFIRDPKQQIMRARFGFGERIESMIPQCHFSLAAAPDVFHLAIDKGADIMIDDATSAIIINRIPEWYKRTLAAKKFLLLPVVVKNQTVGLFYADSDRIDTPAINPQQLGLLRTLRSQVVLAFKQKM